MSSLCQVRADTNLGIEKILFFNFCTPFRNCFAVGLLWGGCPFQSDTNRIQKHTASVNWKACARVLPASRQSACRADPLHESSAACRVRVALPVSQSVRCAYALPPVRAPRPRSVACQGPPSMICRASRPRPHGTKCCFVGKYATKTGIWAMKRIKSRRKMGTNEREINLDRARKESERHG